MYCTSYILLVVIYIPGGWKHVSTMRWKYLTRQSDLSQCHLTVLCVYAELSIQSQSLFLPDVRCRPIHRPNVRFTIWDRMNSERITSEQARICDAIYWFTKLRHLFFYIEGRYNKILHMLLQMHDTDIRESNDTIHPCDKTVLAYYDYLAETKHNR